MKLLVVNWNDLKNPFAGGAEVHLEELLRRLVTFGHDVTLLCSNFAGGAEEETIEGVRIVRRGNRYNFNLIAPFHLRRLAAATAYDLLIEDINKIPFYTPLYLNLPKLIVVPHLFATTVFHEINFVLGSYIYLAERPLVWVYRGLPFNVISESTSDDLAARGIPRTDISVVHCGIDRSLYRHDPSVAKYERPTMLYLGRIKKYKSVQHLIDAFAVVQKSLPESRLVVVGDGDYLPALRGQAARLGLADRVEFTGYVSAGEKVERLRRAHVAVLPSLKEGWGLTNIEANSVGTTVIAANSPGLRDSVQHNQTGLLYSYGDIGELARQLLLVLTDGDRRCRLEQGGLAWAETFSWDRAAHQFNQLIESVAGR